MWRFSSISPLNTSTCLPPSSVVCLSVALSADATETDVLWGQMLEAGGRVSLAGALCHRLASLLKRYKRTVLARATTGITGFMQRVELFKRVMASSTLSCSCLLSLCVIRLFVLSVNGLENPGPPSSISCFLSPSFRPSIITSGRGGRRSLAERIFENQTKAAERESLVPEKRQVNQE